MLLAISISDEEAQKMEKISIIVVDDHPLFRQGVVDVFSLEDDLNIVGQAENGEEALLLIRELNPDVAILDVNLPGLNGQQVMRHVVSEKLPTRIILLTAYDDLEQMVHAMKGGAAAYCSKDVQPNKLVDVIHQVVRGRFVLGDQVLEPSGLELWLSVKTESAMRAYGDPGEPFYPLSDREMEVLSYVTRGMSNKEIASSLGISHQTVKNHVTSILRKLGVEDRTQAAIFALRRGWVRLDQLNSESQEQTNG
jgi:DNA-binding NarL/FixJ family response regulator